MALQLERGTYSTLNSTAAWIWDRIGEGATVVELADAMAARYAVSSGRAEEDLAEWITEMIAEGLVEIDPDEPGVG